MWARYAIAAAAFASLSVVQRPGTPSTSTYSWATNACQYGFVKAMVFSPVTS
jgi:hypothetical protein